MYSPTTTAFPRDPNIVSNLYTQLLNPNTVNRISVAISNRLDQELTLEGKKMTVNQAEIVNTLKHLIDRRLRVFNNDIENLVQYIYDECVSILVCSAKAHIQDLYTKSSTNVWEAEKIGRTVAINQTLNTSRRSYNSNITDLDFRF